MVSDLKEAYKMYIRMNTRTRGRAGVRGDSPADVPSDKPTDKPRPARVKPFDPIAAVIAKYTELGWKCARVKGINDIIAHNDTKMHFVQVVTPDTINDPRYQGVSNNTFIQNAFSNNAIPIFARVVTSNVKDQLRVKITFEDVNANTRVYVRAVKK